MMFPVVRSSSYQVFCIVIFKGTEPRGLSGCFQNVEVGRVTPGSDARAGGRARCLWRQKWPGTRVHEIADLPVPPPAPPSDCPATTRLGLSEGLRVRLTSCFKVFIATGERGQRGRECRWVCGVP